MLPYNILFSMAGDATGFYEYLFLLHTWTHWWLNMIPVTQCCTHLSLSCMWLMVSHDRKLCERQKIAATNEWCCLVAKYWLMSRGYCNDVILSASVMLVFVVFFRRRYFQNIVVNWFIFVDRNLTHSECLAKSSVRRSEIGIKIIWVEKWSKIKIEITEWFEIEIIMMIFKPLKSQNCYKQFNDRLIVTTHVSLLVGHHWNPYWFAFKISSFLNVGNCQWLICYRRRQRCYCIFTKTVQTPSLQIYVISSNLS